MPSRRGTQADDIDLDDFFDEILGECGPTSSSISGIGSVPEQSPPRCSGTHPLTTPAVAGYTPEKETPSADPTGFCADRSNVNPSGRPQGSTSAVTFSHDCCRVLTRPVNVNPVTPTAEDSDSDKTRRPLAEDAILTEAHSAAADREQSLQALAHASYLQELVRNEAREYSALLQSESNQARLATEAQYRVNEQDCDAQKTANEVVGRGLIRALRSPPETTPIHLPRSLRNLSLS